MAVPKCDICGGPFISDADGEIFTCEHCGTRYPKERVRKMYVETGESGRAAVSANTENLHKRACMLLEDQEWKKAGAVFDELLKTAPEYAPAHVGAMLAAQHISRERDLGGTVMAYEQLPEFQKALRFASDDYKSVLDGYMNAANKTRGALYQKAVDAVKVGDHVEVWRLFRELALAQYQDSHLHYLEALKQCREKAHRYAPLLSASEFCMAVKTDGTVYGGQKEWQDIVAISHFSVSAIGLKSDGTVIAYYQGSDPFQYAVAGWRDITAVAAGLFSVFGLKKGGTVVVASKSDTSGHSQVSGWHHIAAISAGGTHAVGLKTDGTVIAVGLNDYGQCEVSDWRDIVAVAAGPLYTIGLRANGTAVLVGKGIPNSRDTLDVSGWQNIIAVSAGAGCATGLRPDGTVVTTVDQQNQGRSDVAEWRDIAAVAVGNKRTYGIKTDGTLVMAGNQSTIEKDWRGIGPYSPELALQSRRRAEQELQHRQRRRDEQARQWAAQGLCRYCGGPLGGVFTKKCKSCGQAN